MTINYIETMKQAHEAMMDVAWDEEGFCMNADLAEAADNLRAAIDAAEMEKQEPVAWCVAYDDPRMGRIHSSPSMCEPQVDAHVAKCEGRIVKVPLYTRPAPAVPEVDCSICTNRGGVYGFSQESNCEHCVWELASWRKNLFAAPTPPTALAKVGADKTGEK